MNFFSNINYIELRNGFNATVIITYSQKIDIKIDNELRYSQFLKLLKY